MCILEQEIHIISKGNKMRTNIVIDDKLMKLALESTGLKTKKEVVEEGLKALIKIKSQAKLKCSHGLININY